MVDQKLTEVFSWLITLPFEITAAGTKHLFSPCSETVAIADD